MFWPVLLLYLHSLKMGCCFFALLIVWFYDLKWEYSHWLLKSVCTDKNTACKRVHFLKFLFKPKFKRSSGTWVVTWLLTFKTFLLYILIYVISTVITLNQTRSFALPVALLKLTLFCLSFLMLSFAIPRMIACVHMCMVVVQELVKWLIGIHEKWQNSIKKSPCCQITFSCRFTTSL